ncbi:ABC transporter permease [Clostridium cadaveris]|mgnify:CR=1 FL=1|uniref:ABC transporter permease n=2 Tax=Clostridium cadaveris TaxID=1529 RepID=UPI0004264ED4|nr:ABC-2 family transporter protein [Clostridium cadaveris]
MKNMKRLKNCYLYIFLNAKTAFNSQYVYKAASLLNFLTQVILILAQYFLWNAIYSNTTSVNNFTFEDMITYLVLSFSMGRLYPFSVSGKFGRMVKNGDIIHNLLKPVKIEYQLFTDSLGELFYKMIFIALPIILTGYLFLDIHIMVDMSTFIMALIFWISSYVFIFTLELSIGVFSYYTNSLWGINNFKSSIISILSGKILPINFYPKLFQSIIYYLPFSTIYFVPINILLNKPINDAFTLLLILWGSIAILYCFYKVMSKIMIRKIMIQGG